MRVPFYCGIVSAASVKILDWIPGTSTNTILLICVIPVGLFLPFGPLLLIPAIQLRSLKVAVKALLLSLVLLVGDIILSSFFSIDNRILSGLPLIVPGGLNQMNRGADRIFVPESGDLHSDHNPGSCANLQEHANFRVPLLGEDTDRCACSDGYLEHGNRSDHGYLVRCGYKFSSASS